MPTTEQITFVVAAYNAARSEIVERLKMREDLIKVYLVACLTFAGGSLAQTNETAAFYLALVTPFLSVPIAIMVRQQKVAVESLAIYLRTKLAPVIDELKVPTWDVFTKEDAENEELKSRWTLYGNFFGIHFFTFCSVIVAWLRGYALGSTAILFLAIATVCAIWAGCVTIESSALRKEILKAYPKTKDIWVGKFLRSRRDN